MNKIERVANDVYDRVLNYGYEPVSAQLVSDYDLASSLTLTRVKQEVKKRFGENDAVWGYDPGLNRFVLAPSHDCDQRRRVINYAIEHASTAANSIRYQVAGAEGSGSITTESAKAASEMLARASGSIESAQYVLKWTDADEYKVIDLGERVSA